MKIMQIVGARPQFIKAHILNEALQQEIKLQNLNLKSIIFFTAQHYDKNLSLDIIKDLNLHIDFYINFQTRKYEKFKNNIALSSLNINVASRMALMIEIISSFIMDHKIDCVIVYGDTDSTLAGSVAANLLNKKLIHIESGLRSYTNIAEERNRILTDQLSDILFAPTLRAFEILHKELPCNKNRQILQCGDIMKDSIKFFESKFRAPFKIAKDYIFVTLHRGENVDDMKKLKEILNSINNLCKEHDIIFSLHPRLLNNIQLHKNKNVAWKVYKTSKYKFKINDFDIIFTMPLKYTHTQYLLKHAHLIITDSGGLQKEAFYHHKNCIVLRDTSEWMELVENNFSTLANAKNLNIYHKFNQSYDIDLYGNYENAKKIVNDILELL